MPELNFEPEVQIIQLEEPQIFLRSKKPQMPKEEAPDLLELNPSDFMYF